MPTTLVSHHRPGGGFRNPWPGSDPQPFAGLLRWPLYERRVHPARPNPPPSAFPRARPTFATLCAIGRRCGPFDATLLPIGTYEPRWFKRVARMNAEEAVRAYLELRAGERGPGKRELTGEAPTPGRGCRTTIE